MAYELRNNEEQGIDRLPIQFKDSTQLQNLLKTYLKGVDDLQDDTQAYIEGIRISNAIGVQLDIVGNIVGESRLSRNDDDYRAAIRTRIILNTAKGRPRDVYAAARAITSSDTANFWEHFPASVVVAVGGDNLDAIPNNAREVVDQSVVAGVRVSELLIDTDNDGLVFGEIVYVEGTITTDTDDDLVDDEGNFIGYQISTESVSGNSSLFGEIAYDNLTSDPDGDQYTLNGDDWVVSDLTFDEGETGTIFFEALR